MAILGAPRTAAKRVPQNPFAAWKAKQEQHKRALAEQAARQIVNDTAKNEAKIIETLQSVDFIHSPLPKEVLETRSNPKHPCGDLEYGARAVVSWLSKNPQLTKADLRPIDQRILTLALQFKEAVEQGDQQAAYTARAALMRSMKDIRGRVPQVNTERGKEFVQANAHYLDQWIDLVDMAKKSDSQARNIARRRGDYEKAKKTLDDEKTQLAEELQKDKKLFEAFDVVHKNKNIAERSKWSVEEREMHATFVEQRFAEVQLNLRHTGLMDSENKYSMENTRIDTLRTKLLDEVFIPDPDEMNKFQKAVDEIFEDMAKTNQELDEMLQSTDVIQGRLDQMLNTPGQVRAREIAAEQADAFLKEIREKQEAELKNIGANNGNLLSKYGIRNEEEMQELKRQQEQAMEEAMNAEVQEEAAQNEQTNEEQQYQYNT